MFFQKFDTAERGQAWAEDELVRRAEAENAAGIDSDDVFARLDFEGAKLPTPDAMARKGGSLSEEMRAVYDSLPAGLKRKYFADRNVKLDELAESLGYETEAELISALSDAAGRVADGYDVGNARDFRLPKKAEKSNASSAVWKNPLRSGFGETVKRKIEQFKNELENRVLNDEERGIYDVTTGQSRVFKIQINDLDTLGDYVTYLAGGRNKGAKKIIFKHYGENATGIVSADEILQMGRIIRDNEPISQGEMRIYEEIANDGATLRVVVGRDKKQNQTIVSFYSNKNERFPAGVKPLTKQRELLHHIPVETFQPSQSESVPESQGKNLRSYEKRDFEDVNADGFVPAAQASIEKSLADDAANAAKWVAMTPEERIAEACPDFTDKAIQLSKAQARKNAGHPLPAYGGLKLELAALKSGKFKIIEDGKKLKPIKVFRDEAQAREFLDKWILAYADAGKITYYAPADVRGVFADAGGLSAENAYVRDAKGEIKVDGIVMRKAKPERLVRDVFVTNWDREYDRVKDEKAELEKLNRRDFESVDEFKRWLEKNSAEVEKKFGSIRMEYRFDEENLGKPYAEEKAEIARRQQFWLDNNVDDLARIYKARIKEEEFDFEDEFDDGDGLVWDDDGDGSFGAPAELGGGNVVKQKALELRRKLKSIFERIIADKIPNAMFPFGKVSRRTVDKVLDLTSSKVDLSGYEHVISSNSVYHAQKRGHFEGNNYPDSLPLTNEDLLRVGDVVENWDDITYRKRKNADAITYKKAYSDGTILYVEEILNGDAHGRPKRLASKSIYKRKAESSTDTAEASRYNVQNDESPQPFGYEQSENASESQGKNLYGEADEGFGAGGRAQMGSSLDPMPPDLTMPKDGRFDPRRVDSSPRVGYDASAAQAAFDGVWDTLGNVKRGYSSAQIREVEAKMREFSLRLDPRMLELPELIAFAERILKGGVHAVRGFKGNWLGAYRGGTRSIELLTDLFKLVGDCRRYEVALDAACDVLKEKGFNPEIVDSRRPDQIIQAVYENKLLSQYRAAFEKKINVEFGKAKRNGEPSAALMVAAHEIMHAMDDLRADGSRLGARGGGILGAIIGEVPRQVRAVSKIRGWGEVLSPDVRKSISKCSKIL